MGKGQGGNSCVWARLREAESSTHSPAASPVLLLFLSPMNRDITEAQQVYTGLPSSRLESRRQVLGA